MISIHRNVSLMQAANCWLCLHIGSTALVIGRWPAGYGMQVEIATDYHWFRFRWPFSEAAWKARRARAARK